MAFFLGLDCILNAPRVVQKSTGVTSLDEKAEVGGCGEVVGVRSIRPHPLRSWISRTPLWMPMKKNTRRPSIVQKSRIKFDYRSRGWKVVGGDPQSHHRPSPISISHFIPKLSDYLEWRPRISLQLRQTSAMMSLKDHFTRYTLLPPTASSDNGLRRFYQ